MLRLLGYIFRESRLVLRFCPERVGSNFCFVYWGWEGDLRWLALPTSRTRAKVRRLTSTRPGTPGIRARDCRMTVRDLFGYQFRVE